MLKQKVINEYAVKRVYQKLFKEKMPDDIADGALAQMLGSGVCNMMEKVNIHLEVR